MDSLEFVSSGTMVFPNIVAFSHVGVVKLFLPAKGYGFIKTVSGEVYMNVADILGKAPEKEAK